MQMSSDHNIHETGYSRKIRVLSVLVYLLPMIAAVIAVLIEHGKQYIYSTYSILYVLGAMLGAFGIRAFLLRRIRAHVGGKTPEPSKHKAHSFHIWEKLACILLVISVFCLFWFQMAPNPDYRDVLVSYSSGKSGGDLSAETLDSPEMKWILKVTGFYGYQTGTADQIAGVDFSYPVNLPDVENWLKIYWGIHDREDAIAVIHSMQEYGHRARLRAYTRVNPWFSAYYHKHHGSDALQATLDIKDPGLYDMDKKSYYFAYSRTHEMLFNVVKLQGALSAVEQSGLRKGLMAYDYMRLMRVAQMCYLAGYFSGDEMLKTCLPMARALQENYDSFEEIHMNYLYGEEFRSQRRFSEASHHVGELGRQISDMKFYGYYEDTEPAEYPFDDFVAVDYDVNLTAEQ